MGEQLRASIWSLPDSDQWWMVKSKKSYYITAAQGHGNSLWSLCVSLSLYSGGTRWQGPIVGKANGQLKLAASMSKQDFEPAMIGQMTVLLLLE